MDLPVKKPYIFIVSFCLAFAITQKMPVSGQPAAQRPERVELYLKKYRYLAVELSQKTAIPMPLILAVAGLESDWGSSELAINANNHFGLKVKSPDEISTYCKNTQEFTYNAYAAYAYESLECFRKYKLIRDSYQDFGDFLTTRERYQHLFQISPKELSAWTQGLQNSGYATDPEYALKLTRIIEEYNLKDL